MVRRLSWIAAVVAVLLGRSVPAVAATISVSPGGTLTGPAGATLGWGYDVSADADLDLSFVGISADVPSSNGSIVVLFDFPLVAAGSSVHLDYDSSLGLGLAELTLSPSLLPGDTVVGRVFLDYVLTDPLGIRADQFDSIELTLSAAVPPSDTPVPEPATLLLTATGAVALWRRRSGAMAA